MRKPAAKSPFRRSGTSAAKRGDGQARLARPAPKRKAPAKKEPRAPRPAPVLSGKRRRDLRAAAHHLEPIVQVGHQGVTDAVVNQVDRALADHELIKVRLHEPEDKKAMAADLAARSRSALCGLIGHTAILYRPDPDKPRSFAAGHDRHDRNVRKTP